MSATPAAAVWLSAIVMLTVVGSPRAFVMVEAGVNIEPNPNGEVGLMSSESKYFNCKSDSRGTQELLSWVDNNGKEIVNDPANRIYTTQKKNMVKLELKNPQKEDTGTYKCVSRNKNGQETSWAYFKLVVFNPTTVSGTTNYLKSEGTRFTMDCTATSDRDATVEFTWMFENHDLSQDNKYRIDTVHEKVRDEIRTVSRLEIRNTTKDHDGKYTCLVDTTNRFLSDEKELRINLHVQYKPRFDEKTPKSIWISEEAVQQGGPLSVNISCIVYADPVAKINWKAWNGAPVQTQPHPLPNQNMRTVISDAENMSSLTLHYQSIHELKNPKMSMRHRYTCSAANSQGSASNTFEIKVGRIPDSPQIVHIEYKDGSIVLNLNESHVEPPVDIYRLEISDEQAHLFNKSSSTNPREPNNNTYVIELNLPRGEHKVNLFAHNPVGWSENPYGSYFFTVVSGAPHHLGMAWHTWLLTLGLLTAAQLLMMEGRGMAGRFFMGALIQF